MPDSSKNALTHGLFAVRYFVREGEQDEYAETLASVIADLAPEGAIEETFAAEIVGATWRLRRCRLVEQSFSASALDPMVDDILGKQQISVDRARAQSHNILRRSLAELKKLQTERAARDSEQRAEQRTIAALLKELAGEEYQDDDEDSFCEELPPEVAQASACETNPEPTPRGAQCPCGSGQKYKRCCGKDAPPVLNKAA